VRTIHKTQGYTIVDKVVIDLSGRATPHAHYTAISRVTTMSHLYFLDLCPTKILTDTQVEKVLDNIHTNSQMKLSYKPPYNKPSWHPKVIYHNIRSLVQHYNDICNDPTYTSADIIALAETNLTTCHSNIDFHIPGFHPLQHNDHQKQQGTRQSLGLAIYVNNTYQITQVIHSDQADFQYTILHIVSDNLYPLQVVAIYRRPSCSKTTLYQQLASIRQQLNTRREFVIIGDFNVNASDSANSTTITTMETIIGHERLQPKTPQYNTQIDLAFTNLITAKLKVIPSSLSDHSLFFHY